MGTEGVWIAIGRSLALAIVVAGSGAPQASAPKSGATYNAGIRFIAGYLGDELMRLVVWHPTRKEEGGVTLGPFHLKAAKDAPLEKGRFGLIVLSHGSGGGALNHRDTARALARSGYIVVAVNHPGDNWQDGSRTGTSANWNARPAHLTAAIDAILADKALGPAVDRRRIGAVGHSAGGYTVLASAGAVPDLSTLTRHCTKRYAVDRKFCNYGRKSRARAKKPGSQRRLLVTPDSRLRAVVAFAPVGAIFGEGAFASVKAKILVYRGGKDTVLRFPFHAENIHRLIGRRHDYVVVPSAGHFSFIAPFPKSMRARIGRPAADPPGTDRAAIHARLNSEIVGFFARALR